MEKNVGKNYLYNIIYQIIALAAPLITTPYVSRALGAEGVGIYSWTYSIATIFTLFAVLGTTVYGRREIAFVQDDSGKRNRVFWDIFILRVFTTVLCLAVYSVYIYLLVDNSKKMYMLIQGIYILASIFDVTWFFQGMEDFKSIVIRNIIIKFVGILFIILLVNDVDDLFLYICGLAIIALVSNLSLIPALKKYISAPILQKAHPFSHIKGTVQLFIPTIASQVYLTLDKVMLGYFTVSSVQNGYYEQAQKIIMICWTFVTTFATVMTPRFANIFMNGDVEKTNHCLKNSYRTVWMISSPIVFGVAAIAENLVPWFFGEEFAPVIVLLYIFSAIIFPVGLNAVTGSQYLVVIKKHTIYTVSIVAGAVVNFSLNIYLIPRYYAVGAAIASVIAEYVIAAIQIIYVSFVIKSISIKTVFCGVQNYFGAGVLMFSAVKVVSNHMDSTMANTGILVAVGAMVYIGLLALMKDYLIKEIMNQVKTRFKRAS